MTPRKPTLAALAVTILAGIAAAPAPQAPQAPLPTGTPLYFYGMVYLSGRIEFRDARDELYPNYFYEGKYGDVRGKMTFDPANPQLAFSLACTKLCQPNDGMDLKILGELMDVQKIPLARFTAKRIGPWQPAAADKKIAPFEQATIEGELEVDGRKVQVSGTGNIHYNTPKGGDLRGLAANSLLGTSATIRIDFTIKGKDLGLKKVADRDILVAVHTRAYTEATILASTKKKSLDEAGVKQTP